VKFADRLKRFLRRQPRIVFLVSVITIAVLIVVTPGIVQYFEPSPLAKPVPVLVYPQVHSDSHLPVRKNVVNLTPQEKTAFVNAIKALTTTIPEGSQLSIYDQIVLKHVFTMGFGGNPESTGSLKVNPAHGRAAFLPWHRQYLLEFEQALQAIDPSVTVPYWDWTDPNALDVILQEDFLGTNGQGMTVEIPGAGTFTGGLVTSGIFADWTLNPDIHFEWQTQASFGSTLRRFVAVPPFDQYPLPKSAVEALFNFDQYEVFNALVEGAESLNRQGKLVEDWVLHAYIHTLIGGVLVEDAYPKRGLPKEIEALGTMNSIPCSPYDPIFWLNHANVDRLWAEWQDQGHTDTTFFPATGNPFGHNLNDPMWPWDNGLSTPGNLGPGNLLALLPEITANSVVTPADVLDFRALGYTYDTTRVAANHDNHHS
jgi:tyrosinase